MVVALVAWSTLVFGISTYVVVTSPATLVHGLIVWALAGPVFVTAMVAADLAKAWAERALRQWTGRSLAWREAAPASGQRATGAATTAAAPQVVRWTGIEIRLPADARIAAPDVERRVRPPRETVRAATTGAA